MNRIYISAVLVLSAVTLLYSQEKQEQQGKDPVPVQAQYSDEIRVKGVNFNKKIDLTGKGEVLETEFIIENMTDDPIELYVFTLASYEKFIRNETSFDRPMPPEERMKNFSAFPGSKDNFKYIVRENDGKPKKDGDGHEVYEYLKHPIDFKKGVNPDTGSVYRLTDRLVLRHEHLSPYRNNYFYFNEAAVLIFDSKGRLLFRQLYDLRSWRR